MAHGLKAIIRQIAVDTRTSNPLRRNQRQPSTRNVGSITQAHGPRHVLRKVRVEFPDAGEY
jgi:hypothetical protein